MIEGAATPRLPRSTALTNVPQKSKKITHQRYPFLAWSIEVALYGIVAEKKCFSNGQTRRQLA
jgi:hypothetical protein